MVALLVLSGRPAVMGGLASGRRMRFLLGAATVLTVALNAVLLLQTFGIVAG
jgi:Mn2+/Fe2+ NRAMP family transporter